MEEDVFLDLRLSRGRICTWIQGCQGQISRLLGGYTKGDYKLMPVMVYHSANPLALNSYIKHLLPMHFFQVSRGGQQS